MCGSWQIYAINTGCLKWNPRFWDEYYYFIVQLRQKIKLNPSMKQKRYLKLYFRIRIFWKLCPAEGSYFLLESVKGLKTCVNFLLDSDNVKKSEPPTGHNFQNILILKHDFKYCLCPIEGFSLFFGLSWTIKSYYSSQKRGFHLRHPVERVLTECLISPNIIL